MIITELKYSHFNLYFKTPFKTHKDIFNTREGFLIALMNDKNIIGYGECSPLPGYSYEDLYECEEQLQKLTRILNNFEIGNDIAFLEKFFSKRIFFPSVHFGIEQCLLSLIISGNASFIQNKFKITKKEIDVYAVMEAEDKLDIISSIEKKITDGYKTFKIKLGNERFDNDFKLIESIRKYFGNEINLCLDVNGAWDKHEAAEHIKFLSPLKIQFIEEPCEHLDSVIEIAKKSPIPIAVGHSMNTAADVLNIIKFSNVEYIVLKPTIISGFLSSMRLIEEAEKKKKKIIISSSFESSVGKSALVFLASMVSHKAAHDLDTSAQFDFNVCNDFYSIDKGKISFESASYPPKFDIVQQ
jgi:o-succinylbenzoate synthase